MVEQAPKYIEFGRYSIDRKKYGKGVLQFRSKKGNPIAGLKSLHMTDNIKAVVEKLVNDQVIDYSDIDKLNEEERVVLADIAQKCDINDRLKIPTPKLTKLQSDINRFYVLRGEVVAGNDSKEAIRELKLLLVKLMGNGSISKPEGSSVLYELLLLGF